MKVKLNSGVEYWVSFFHHVKNDKSPYTKCIIENNNEKNLVGIGVATLAIGDRFCKDKGRKIAMKRALTNLDLSKEVRLLFWNTYFLMTNKKHLLK